MHKAIVLATILGVWIATLGLSTPSYAFGKGDRGLFGSVYKQVRMARALELDQTQREQFRSILAAAQSEVADIVEGLMSTREALRELERSATFDEPKVSEVARQRGELMASMIVVRAASLLATVIPPRRA